jgi:predicted transcriptional regulator
MKSVAVTTAINLADEVKTRGDELEQAIGEALEDVDAGRTVDRDAMIQWLGSLDTSSELPAPKVETSRGCI